VFRECFLFGLIFQADRASGVKPVDLPSQLGLMPNVKSAVLEVFVIGNASRAYKADPATEAGGSESRWTFASPITIKRFLRPKEESAME
jgi:hypothetical protein